MNLPALQGFEIPDWVFQVFLVLLLSGVVNLLLSRIFKKLGEGTRWTRIFWDDALVSACRKPAIWLVWLAGTGWAVDIIWQATGTVIFSGLASLRDVALISLLGWALVRFIRELEKHYLDPEKEAGKKSDPTTTIAIGRLLRTAVIIATVLVVVQTLGYSISGVLAFGGVGGLAVGFAAKDLLANFFGGLMIYLDKPFRVGDWIRSPDKEIEGYVEYIGWRLTRIRTFDKRPLYVPNATFTMISVENPSRMENRRIKETVGLRYQDSAKVPVILQEIREYLHENDEIDKGKILMVNFNQFGASSLDFFIYCFTKTTNWAEYHLIKEQVLLRIMEIVHRHGADIAFPTRTLDLPQGSLPVSDGSDEGHQTT